MANGPLVGAITGATGGRADARSVEVPAGAYVIPAVVVSHLGQGNTLAGNRVLDEMFGARGGFASGGGVNRASVPIYAADGEYVIPPETVAILGHGDMKRGHDVLDHFVEIQKAQAAKAIRKLPGPRKR